MSDKARPTMDIDVFLLTLDREDEINEIFTLLNIEDVTIVASVPDPGEMEISESISFDNIIVHVPDFYSLAITKLFTSRQKDEDDLIGYILPNIEDWGKLERLVIENKIDFVGNIENPDLNANNLKRYKDIIQK